MVAPLLLSGNQDWDFYGATIFVNGEIFERGVGLLALVEEVT